MASDFSRFSFTLDEFILRDLINDNQRGAPFRGFGVLFSGYGLFKKAKFSNPIVELNRRVGEHLLEWIMTGSPLP